ncbi:MAG: cytidine/deoxycytidylate deaminase family protein [Thermodesulfobacteriota bacterium]|nr:cytidine/deoxycytidylate deaminase family protein [Thermodesulfobacteriota bacterium]
MTRPSWSEYFMSIAKLVATRSTCLRRHVGAVLVKDKRIIATGYNGAPAGIRHCEETGCLREKLGVKSGERHELCRGLHAEQNVIIQAAYYGVSTKETILYSTHKPCIICSKMLINAGVKKIFFSEGYPDSLADEMIAEAHIEIERLET